MENWNQIFQENGAIWIHDGDPRRPHALLTSGLHSDGFVNCTFVTQRPNLLQRVITEGMAAILSEVKPGWVIGSAFGAITLAYAIALQLNARVGFTEKDGESMKLARFEIESSETVLVVEDTISTGGSTLKTLDGIRKSGVEDSRILPYIVCLVNRSGSNDLQGRSIRALLTLNIHAWKPEECPLCKQGSQAVRPKSNWHELVRKT